MTESNPINILLIEDNIDHAELIRDVFIDADPSNKINHVLNGELAMAYLERQSPYDDPQVYPFPDIIFLDLRMPRQDGMATLKAIKSANTLKHLPVIIVSTSKTKSEIMKCYQLGANGFITKPVGFDEFYNKFKALQQYWACISELPTR